MLSGLDRDKGDLTHNTWGGGAASHTLAIVIASPDFRSTWALVLDNDCIQFFCSCRSQ